MSTHDRPEPQPRQDEARPRPDDTASRPGENDEATSVERHAATEPAHPVPAPGEPPGDMWPGVNAVRGDADDEEVDGVDDIALAPPGKPDGEVDTRP